MASAPTFRSTSGLPVRLTGHWSSLQLATAALRSRLLRQRAGVDRRRCFERVAASLRSNGRFAWNAFAFDHHFASALDGQHADTPLPHTNYYSVSDNRVETSPWTMVEPVRSGGRLRTNGWGSSMSRACGWKLSMADSPANRSTTTAPSTSSWPVARRPAWPSRQRQGTFPHTGAAEPRCAGSARARIA